MRRCRITGSVLSSDVGLLDAMQRELDLPFTLEEVCPIAMELVFVLRKS